MVAVATEDIATAMTTMAAGTTTAETAMAVEEVLVDTENKSKLIFVMNYLRGEGRLSKCDFSFCSCMCEYSPKLLTFFAYTWLL